ncbi:MAG: metallophosphoesterase family protein [Anaerolineaceae bacterium]
MKIRILLILSVVLLISGCVYQPVPSSPSSTPQPVIASQTAAPTTIVAPSESPSAVSNPLSEITFKKGPYLVPGNDPGTMNILWQAGDASRFQVEWGTDSNDSLEKVAPASVTPDGLATAVLTGLQQGNHYFYRVTDGKSQAVGSFNTPPAASDQLTFWVYGDSRSGQEIQNTITGDILADIQSKPADQTFVLFTGDIMDEAVASNLQNDQFDPQYASTRRLMSELPMVNAMGNHDGTQLFIKYFPYHFAGHFYWSFDYGPVHVAVIDQYADVSENSPQWQWLNQDLANSAQPWKFILLHEPGWSAGPHPNNEAVQKIIQNIAYHQHVAVIFAGHNHYYARAQVDGVVHITTGGGGAPLYDPEPNAPNVVVAKKEFHYLKVQISGSQLTITALMPDNQVIDTFTLQH